MSSTSAKIGSRGEGREFRPLGRLQATPHPITRRQFATGLAGLFAAAHCTRLFAVAKQIRFGVFSLFEARELTLEASHGPLLLAINGQRYVLTPGAGPAHVRAASGRAFTITLEDQAIAATHLTATATLGAAATFTLAVPPSARHGSIRRDFHGLFELNAAADPHPLRPPALQPIISIDLETAVASITAAEGSPNAPLAFLMAQAIAARSFLMAARTAHTGYDFCDTTHCQYLRGPATLGSAAELAARRTAGIVLIYRNQPVAAMYSRSCSGRTHSLGELGLPAATYPYYPVACEFCLRHPELWHRDLNQATQPHTERERILFNRIHGWAAIPSTSYTRLEGRGIGHGLGLCQRGAAAMASLGASFEAILTHYYPNTSIGPA